MAAFYFIIHRNIVQLNSAVSIKNTKWKKVHIQVRKEYHSDPLEDKLIFNPYLMIGQSCTFTVDNGDDISYRSDRDPDHPDGVHFTGWNYANFNDSSTCIVDNP